MPIYHAPVKDTHFVLNDVLGLRPLFQPPRFLQRHARFCRRDPRGSRQVLRRGASAAEQVGDEVGCKRNDDGSVTTPPGFKDAYSSSARRLADTHRARGIWRPGPAAGHRHCDRRICPVRQSQFRDVSGADLGRDRLAAGQGVSDELKQTYVPNMVTGKWTGTMNLTEPHCGTDLGLLKTRAEPESTTAAIRSPAPRSSSHRASTTLAKTSSTWSSPRSPARPTM